MGHAAELLGALPLRHGPDGLLGGAIGQRRLQADDWQYLACHRGLELGLIAGRRGACAARHWGALCGE